MVKEKNIPVTVEEYINNHPAPVRKKLKELRKIILQNAKGAEEKISWGMPAYKLGGVLCYFAAHKNHIGFYPLASGIKNFEKELKNFNYSKGTVQFPFTSPIPASLVKKILLFRVKENKLKTVVKKSAPKRAAKSI